MHDVSNFALYDEFMQTPLVSFDQYVKIKEKDENDRTQNETREFNKYRKLLNVDMIADAERLTSKLHKSMIQNNARQQKIYNIKKLVNSVLSLMNGYQHEIIDTKLEKCELYTQNKEQDNIYSLQVQKYFAEHYKYEIMRMKQTHADRSDEWWRRSITEPHEIHEALRFLGFNSVIDSRVIQTNFEVMVNKIRMNERMRLFVGNGNDKPYITHTPGTPYFFIHRINRRVFEMYDIKIITTNNPDCMYLMPIG